MHQNGIPANAVEAELGKILSSGVFSKAHRASRFLRFAVHQYLEGRSSELKEYVIGVEVLGRKADFDPRIDPIVRAEARRLRDKLDEYYVSAGKSDNIRISIPKGTYVPAFELNNVPVHATGRKELSRVSARNHWIWLASAAGLIAIVLLWRFGTAVPEDVPVPTPLTSYPGRVTSPSFSPDGSQVAFAWRSSEQNHSSIYTKLLNVDEPLRLTRDAVDDYAPAWSPDGASIAFLRAVSPEKDGLLLIPSIGGSTRKVAEVHSTGLSDCYAWQPAWHPSGHWLVVVDKDTGTGPFRLFVVSPETGEKRPLTSPPPNSFGDVYAAFSPDGRTLALARSSAENVSDLYLLDISADLKPRGEPRRVTFEKFYVGGPAWTPDAHTIVFPGGDFHNPGLWKITLLPRITKPLHLPFATEGTTLPAISRQSHLAYAHASGDADILRLDIGKSVGRAKPLISSTRLDHEPQYSPDGKRIAFSSNRSGSHEIWISDGEGLNLVKLTSFGGFGYRASPRWSPDGRKIYFSAIEERGTECWVTSTEGGRPRRLNIAEVTGCPSGWSRDGEWIYFGRDAQVWRMPANHPGAPVQVTFRGGDAATESPDGRFVYYLKSHSNDISTLWRMPVAGGEETKILESVYANCMAVTDQGVYFIASFEHASVRFLNFAKGRVEEIAPIAHHPVWGFSVSPDKRSLLYAEYESPLIHDLMLVKNFR
jgi:Tol biopolymer transport system component